MPRLPAKRLKLCEISPSCTMMLLVGLVGSRAPGSLLCFFEISCTHRTLRDAPQMSAVWDLHWSNKQVRKNNKCVWWGSWEEYLLCGVCGMGCFVLVAAWVETWFSPSSSSSSLADPQPRFPFLTEPLGELPEDKGTPNLTGKKKRKRKKKRRVITRSLLAESRFTIWTQTSSKCLPFYSYIAKVVYLDRDFTWVA